MITRDPAQYYYRRGETLYDLKRYAQAAEEFRQALAINTQMVAAHNLLARCLCEAEEYPAAEYEARQAISLSPQSARYYVTLGWVLYSVGGRLEEAEAAYREALALAPQEAAYHSAYAYMLRNSRRPREALPHDLRAVELQPTDADYLNALGVTYYYLGQFEQARENFRLALGHNPTNHWPHFNLGRTLWRRGESDAALTR